MGFLWFLPSDLTYCFSVFVRNCGLKALTLSPLRTSITVIGSQISFCKSMIHSGQLCNRKISDNWKSVSYSIQLNDWTVEQLNNALCSAQYLAKFTTIAQTWLFGASSTATFQIAKLLYFCVLTRTFSFFPGTKCAFAFFNFFPEFFPDFLENHPNRLNFGECSTDFTRILAHFPSFNDFT